MRKKGLQISFNLDISHPDGTSEYLRTIQKRSNPSSLEVEIAALGARLIASIDQLPERQSLRCKLVEIEPGMNLEGRRYATIAELLAFAVRYPWLARPYKFLPPHLEPEYLLHIDREYLDYYFYPIIDADDVTVTEFLALMVEI